MESTNDLHFINLNYNYLNASSRSRDPEQYEICAFPVFNELLVRLQHAAESFGPRCIYSVPSLVSAITLPNQ
jgi:hypothetical protein